MFSLPTNNTDNAEGYSKQTDRQTDGQTDTHRETDRQRDRQTEKQTDRQTESKMVFWQRREKRCEWHDKYVPKDLRALSEGKKI